MELIVGENSYMTLEEANDLIKQTFISKDNNRVFWDSLSDDDKITLIINNTELIDGNNMLYKGNKLNVGQLMQFPRKDRYGNVIECPKRIKIGLLMQALKDSVVNGRQETLLKDMGVETFKDGSGASITFTTSESSNLKNKQNIYKDVWQRYFSEYSYIC